MLKHNFPIVSTMESYRFALGRPCKQKKQPFKRKHSRSFSMVPHRPSWLLLPNHVTKGFEFWIATMKGDSFASKQATLFESIRKHETPITSEWGFDTRAGEAFRKDYLEKAKVVLGLLHQNQKLRWIFKRLFTRQRLRRFQALNEVDPITLEPFQQPVRFASFAHRKFFVYDAKPFVKLIHQKLVNHDGQLIFPQFPKNPFTNQDFTLAQLVGLLKQCRGYGHTSWAIEAFIQSNYDLGNFGLIHNKPLRLHATRSTFLDLHSWDAIDTLYDFIKSQHEYHTKYFKSNPYKWGLAHVPHHPLLVGWRALCLKWYENDILVDDYEAKDIVWDAIRLKTKDLCEDPVDLIALRNKRKSGVVADGSRTV